MNAILISLPELAERTGLPLAWLKRETDSGRLPCIRAGRRRMFNLEAVLHALDEQQKGKAPHGR